AAAHLDRLALDLAVDVRSGHLGGNERARAGRVGIDAANIGEHADLDDAARNLGPCTGGAGDDRSRREPEGDDWPAHAHELPSIASRHTRYGSLSLIACMPSLTLRPNSTLSHLFNCSHLFAVDSTAPDYPPRRSNLQCVGWAQDGAKAPRCPGRITDARDDTGVTVQSRSSIRMGNLRMRRPVAW